MPIAAKRGYFSNGLKIELQTMCILDCVHFKRKTTKLADLTFFYSLLKRGFRGYQ